MIRPTVLLVGDKDRTEFAEAVGLLRQRTDCHWSASIPAALTHIANAFTPPDVIVVVQSRSGQFHQDQISSLRQAAPLARITALLGSWCEGEARTGRPWPGAMRVYWHQCAPRFDRELARLSSGKCPTWGLPVTATPDEMIDFSMVTDAPLCSGLIAIRARLGCTYDALAGACRSAGYATVWLRDDQHVQVRGPKAVIWDDTYCGERQAARMATTVRAVQPAPVVALFHFLRIDDHRRALAAGAAAALTKPLLMDDLLWHLNRLADTRPAAGDAVK
jgi:hypothetical protein